MNKHCLLIYTLICTLCTICILHTQPAFALEQQQKNLVIQAQQLYFATTIKPTVIDSQYVILKNILFKGNAKTRNSIITRELDFSIGDTLYVADMQKLLQENRQQVFNTGLFNKVNIKVSSWQNNDLSLLIEVEERWYVYPMPIFELTDPFNSWWYQHQRSLKRTDIGMRFVHYNLSGQQDQLKATIQFGYTHKFDLSYEFPFIDKQQRIRFNPFIQYITNREVPYTTLGNQQLFYLHNKRILRSRFATGFELSYRKDIHWEHKFIVNFYQNKIADTLSLITPDYFLDGRTKQKYLYTTYVVRADYRDVHYYPLKGTFINLQFSKAGLGVFKDVNTYWIVGVLSHYLPLGKKLYAVGNARFRLSPTSKQAYYLQEGLGYGNVFMRGYEPYVIEGQSYNLFRTALKYQLFKKEFKTPIFNIKQLSKIPFAMYIKTYAEAAHLPKPIYDTESLLNRKWLNSYGLGVDITTAYDAVMSVEFTHNQLGEWGWYIGIGVNYDL